MTILPITKKNVNAYLKTGFTLASSSKYSLIIRYCIENRILNIQKLNDLLEEYGFTDLIE